MNVVWLGVKIWLFPVRTKKQLNQFEFNEKVTYNSTLATGEQKMSGEQIKKQKHNNK